MRITDPSKGRWKGGYMKDISRTDLPVTREYTTVRGVRIRYSKLDRRYTIVILHGWGSSIDAWTNVQQLLGQQGYGSIAIDLPGFGGSDEPKQPWSVAEYQELVIDFIAQQGLSRFALIGHSFGGRVAVKLGAAHARGLDFLILTGCAGLRHPLTKKQLLLFTAAKSGRALLKFPVIGRLEASFRRVFYEIAGDRDYSQASVVMRQTMVRVIDEDLRPVLPDIVVPTLLIWGKNDRVTPVSDGLEMNRLVPSSNLELVPGGTHRLPYEQPDVFVNLVAQALESGGLR